MVAEVYKLLHSAVEYGPVFPRALVEMRRLRSRVPQELRVILAWITEVMPLTSPEKINVPGSQHSIPPTSIHSSTPHNPDLTTVDHDIPTFAHTLVHSVPTNTLFHRYLSSHPIINHPRLIPAQIPAIPSYPTNQKVAAYSGIVTYSIYPLPVFYTVIELLLLCLYC